MHYNIIKFFLFHSSLQQHALHKFELASLANLCPTNAEEAKTLITRYQQLCSLSFLCLLYVVLHQVHKQMYISLQTLNGEYTHCNIYKIMES